MSHHIVAMILLVCLHTAASEEGIPILQSPAQLWLTPGEPAQLDCSAPKGEWRVIWYKEQQNGSLKWIYQCSQFAPSHPIYLCKANITTRTFSLTISTVQRNDSGVYYCGLSASVHLQPNFGNGTKLIVTDASEPRISILVPSAPDDAELPYHVPLLCLLSDVTPPWRTILWDTGEGASEGQTGAGTIDGVFSAWSLTTILHERWNQETICTCMAKEIGTGRNIRVTVSKETDRRATANCGIVFYAGPPCIFILLLIQLLILLWRKCPARGRAHQRENPIPERQIPQTEYATLTYNRSALL